MPSPANNRPSARLTFLLLAIAGAATTAGAGAADPAYTLRMVPIPHAAGVGVSMDYIAFDPATHSLWAPAGNSGLVMVIDTAGGKVRQIAGQPTGEMVNGERKRLVGPSSVTIGEGWVYVGNRADSSVCAFHPSSLEKGACHRLDSMPDGLAYVAPTQEVWVTTPRDRSVRILDAASLAEKAKLSFDGNPEGFAVDPVRSRFYTNLEDKDRTLAIDLLTHKTAATWNPACGEDGPHGLRVDARAGRLLVACSTRVEVLDLTHDGAVLSSLDTGDGVDDFDYAPATGMVYVGAAKAGQLTIGRVDAAGKLSLVAKVETHVGARNPAVTDTGVVYLAHSSMSDLTDLIVMEPKGEAAAQPPH